MKTALRFRFWAEMGLAIITGILFVITFVWNDWIEIVFHVDPDGGNGAVEWLIVGVLLVATITLVVLVRFEWRRARTAVS
jgi:hypothetical protein